MKEIDPGQSYRLIEPGPVLLVTTHGSDGPNVMTMGFHVMVRHDPPLIGCVIGPWDHSHSALLETGRCVLAVPRATMSRVVTRIGNCSGADIDKFGTFDLSTREGTDGSAPFLTDCIANLECRLVDDVLADRYNLHILAVTRLNVAKDWKTAAMLHHVGGGRFRADGDVFDESEHMVLWRHLDHD
ncbi:flavin reductase family protein [Martelella soudanensis]|uniref:flavin reductase family protein n=1 Tax=unclassified Martelella TaxID=2629616 RepID=UPI0015DED263|nr:MULTISPECIES: flavin reductase family protein [unclassified Martelella]